ncbi:hypothetical protein [Ensifer sp. B1-9]|uniref:hypothetical protein n=1 Tax=Ensifer sp. B1-9 TaxID=3141455 RepID=UPI003D1BD4FE
MNNNKGIPDQFVFTKMQTDAGEDIHAIRNRKELERMAGGTFWWGIGESKGRAIETMRRTVSHPEALFSLMPSRPSPQSREPGEVFLWQSFRTPQGERPLPPHVIVISGGTRNGTPKTRYHALVCASPSSILMNGGGRIDAAKLINIGESGRPVGSSQVTAVVRHSSGTAVLGSRPYEIAARATLEPPFFADLTNPRTLSAAELRLLYDVGGGGKNVEDWLAVTKQLRHL